MDNHDIPGTKLSVVIFCDTIHRDCTNTVNAILGSDNAGSKAHVESILSVMVNVTTEYMVRGDNLMNRARPNPASVSASKR